MLFLGIGFMKQQLQKEQAHFKSCIEEIQLKLTSPTLEAKKLEGQIAEKGESAVLFGRAQWQLYKVHTFFSIILV